MPPMPTSRSEAAPRAGLAVMPEKPSEPPHCSARRSSEAGTGSRVARFTSGKSAWIWSTIIATVLVVPPVSWMVRPWKRSARSVPKRDFIRPTCITSQPRPTKTAAPTFGWVAWPQSTRCRLSKPGPSAAMPQPVPWAKATTPSTFG